MKETVVGSSMASESVPHHLIRRDGACRLAIIIQQIETMVPGCFGEAAAVIRRLAAGDDVALDDLTAAMASVRVALQDIVALHGRA